MRYQFEKPIVSAPFRVSSEDILMLSLRSFPSSDEQRIHARAKKALFRIERGICCRSARHVKRRVEDDRLTSLFSNLTDQPAKERIAASADGLTDRRAIHVNDCGDLVSLLPPLHRKKSV